MKTNLIVLLFGLFVLLAGIVAYSDVQERVIDLPEDGEMWFTSLFLHDDWQRDNQETMIVNAFQSEPRLVKLKSQTIYNTYTESDPHYQQTFSEAITQLPAITVQRPDGTIVYKASGRNVPRSGNAIANSIERTSRRRCWRRGWCEPDEQVEPYREREQRGRLIPINPLEPIPDLIDMGQKAVATKRFFEGSIEYIVLIVAGVFVFFLGNKFKGA